MDDMISWAKYTNISCLLLAHTIVRALTRGERTHGISHIFWDVLVSSRAVSVNLLKFVIATAGDVVIAVSIGWFGAESPRRDLLHTQDIILVLFN